MLKSVIEAVRRAAAAMVAKPGAVLLALVLYLAFTALFYLFVAIRDASVWQLMLSILTTLLAVVVFFALQAVAVGYTRNESTARVLLKRMGKDAMIMLAVSLPLLVLVVIGLLLLGLAGAVTTQAAVTAGKWLIAARIIDALRMILLYLVLPLVAIQLWISATRDGLSSALKNFIKSTITAFSLKSLLTYLIVFVVFGAVAWFLVFTKTQFGGAWVELGLLTARLILAGLVIFFGWFLAVGALRQATEEA
jgi:hypothetical protein